VSVETVDEPNQSAGAAGERSHPDPRPRTAPPRYAIQLAIAWTALLLGLCLAPARVIPDEQTFSIRRYIPWFDLVVHFTLFAGFALNWMRALSTPWRWRFVLASGVLLAIGTELAQGLAFIGRDPDVRDALADGVGLTIGLAAAAFLYSWPRPPGGR
jgi:VanZ family protein